MSKAPTPPVIIIGMHRSGTSMMGSMLEDMGLFCGWKKDRHNEAMFFQKLNQWIMRSANAYWDNPDYTDYIFDNPHIRKATVAYMSQSLSSLRRYSYLGPDKFLAFGSITNLHMPWCWKDPRSTFTLPFWLDIFPDAKIIHIKRHGIDVAQSLKVRAETALNFIPKSPYNWVHNIKHRRSGYCDSAASLSLSAGVTLWDKYVSKADQHVANAGDRSLSIIYEDFLEHPEAVLSELGDFCALEYSSEDIKALVKNVNSDRANAFKKNPGLVAASQEPDICTLLDKHGY